MLRETTHFTDLIKDGLPALKQHLHDQVHRGELTRPEASDIFDLIPNLNFPGFITLCAIGTGEESHKSPDGGFKLQEAAIKAALDRIPSPVKPAEAKQIITLLLSGQFRGDLVDATAIILHVIPDVPITLIQDFKTLPRLPVRLIIAMGRDVGDSPQLIRSLTTDLLQDGRINSQPPILTNTVRVIYAQATVSQIAKTLHALLGNDTIRLAIIIYARSQGVNISQDELDIVREALDPNDPDLGLLLAPAYSRLAKNFGKEGAMAFLQSWVL